MQFAFIFKLNLYFWWKTFKKFTKVQLRRSNCHTIWCYLELKLKYNWKNLLLNIHLKRNREKIWWRTKLLQKGRKIFISCQLDPDIQRRLFLNITYHRVELKVFLCLRRLYHFETDWTFTPVIKPYLFSINMTKKTNLQIIQLFLNSHRNLNTFSNNCKCNRRRMKPILGNQL